MGAAGFIVALLDIVKGPAGAAAQKAIDLAFDPAFNEALSPSAGLTVNPLVFSSVEQEGRWKVKDWGFSSFPNEERQLTNQILAAATGSPIPDPANAPVNFYPNVGGGATATKRGFGPLLTIDIPKPPKSYDFISAALGILNLSASSALFQLAKETILQEGHAEIAADWQHDGIEIWGGFVGLTSANGFGSVFGHRANVQLSGTVYGNYLPGAYLISASGSINPVGPTYIEFRCAAVVQAGKDIQPLYGQKWDRDTGNQTDLRFNKKGGFDLSVNPY